MLLGDSVLSLEKDELLLNIESSELVLLHLDALDQRLRLVRSW